MEAGARDSRRRRFADVFCVAASWQFGCMLMTKECLLRNRTNPCSTSSSNLLVTLSILSNALSEDHCQMIRSHKVCGFRGRGCSSSLAKLVDRVNPAIPLLCKVTEWRIVTQMVRQLLENCWTTGTKIILTGHFCRTANALSLVLPAGQRSRDPYSMKLNLKILCIDW